MRNVNLSQHFPGLWKQGLGWLLLLGPLFFFTYGQVNQFTATRQDVGSVVFSWEKGIPFVPWTIVPYWSIDILYGISLFICTSRQELTRHGYRLAAASLIACTAFLLFPLRFTFSRPHTEGILGWLFQQLEQFDLPYNQAPSLHIILAWLLWLRFRRHLHGTASVLAGFWFMLIAVSVLTTWQHHCIDVISGLIAGIMISYLIPITGEWRWRQPDRRALGLALRYAGGAAALLLTGLLLPYGYGLYWPALSLALVAAAYGGFGTAIFQKSAHGEMTLSASIVLLPYLLGAQACRGVFMRKLPQYAVIIDGVSLGGFPNKHIHQAAVLDLTSECVRASAPVTPWHTCPLLDLVVPEPCQIMEGVAQLRLLREQHDSVLVCCALGLSRSAMLVAAWLLTEGYDRTAQEAVARIQACRPQIILTADHHAVLQQIERAVWQTPL
ncbi:phosphatase PAP2/dual specificity phosphatase family protein [Atlantibacter hermannii]|uniref:phosphatase PAP2/dual specificity phosphatase family protein n=1 Tax=Atlantibacter hermannii TaxID=565 RepID=UPI0028B22625|nr:phosphatase PAP2/dual specificity phosphatase family protein [Atlantibacter hermannii]